MADGTMQRHDWLDPECAGAWDSDPVTGNPLRAEQLDVLLALLEDLYPPGKRILDIGSGSGLVEEQIFRRIPHARIVGVDSSPAMVALSRERLRAYGEQFAVVEHDLTSTNAPPLPPGAYQVAISVQTLHNVADEHKRRAFAFVHAALAPGGCFLLLDRVAIATPSFFPFYHALWRRLDRIHGASIREGDTVAEHAERLAAKGDRPATLEEHLAWLRGVGFEAACLHVHANRALFVARKRQE